MSAYVLPTVNADAINTTTERFGIAESMLVSSSVPEAPPAAYNAGTTYALDAEVSTGTPGGVITCWRSLQAGNIGNTPASSSLWWIETGTTYSAWASGTWAPGDVVLQTATHSVYERTAVSPGASAVEPKDDVLGLWLRVGTTNRWAMFDMLSTAGTTGVSPITVVLEPGRISGLAFLRLNAGEVDVSMTSDAVEVYSHAEVLDGTPISSWDDYFFAEFELQINVVLLDVPTYTDGVLTLVMTGSSDMTIGKCVVGTFVPVGKTQEGPRVRLKSFSVVERDQFGDVTGITKRKSVPLVSQTLIVPKGEIRAARAVLDAARTSPAVFIGMDNDQDDYSDLLTVLGICTDSEISPQANGYSPINVEIEGI